MTGQFIFRCIFTAILLFSIFYVWTNPIDVTKTITKLFTSMVSFKPQVTFANYDNAFAVRYFQKGSTVDANLALLFYDINVVNPSDDNVTIKSVHLRYQIDGANQEVESSVLTTGRVLTPNGDSNSIIVRSSTANNFFMSWKNLRMEIAEHKPIGAKGGVMAGSAIFVLNTKNIEDFAKIKSFELVATDTLGNESARQLPMKSQWIENAKVLLVEDRPFAVDEKGKLTYKD